MQVPARIRLRYIAGAFFLTVPAATSVTALLLGMPIAWWLLIGLGGASLNALTTFLIAKQGWSEYEW